MHLASLALPKRQTERLFVTHGPRFEKFWKNLTDQRRRMYLDLPGISLISDPAMDKIRLIE